MTETQVMIADLAKAGGELSFPEDEIPYSFLAYEEAAKAGLVSRSDGSGWNTEETIRLTKEGRAHCGLPVPTSLLDRIRSLLCLSAT